MASTYKQNATVNLCQVKKKSAATAPTWKSTITVRVSQLMPSLTVAARPIRTSCLAGTAELAPEPKSCSAGVLTDDSSLTGTWEGAANTDAILGMILLEWQYTHSKKNCIGP